MIYIDDVLRSTVEIMEVDESRLNLRTYNVNAMSFTPKEIFEEIRKHVPSFTMSCEPDFRQNIGES